MAAGRPRRDTIVRTASGAAPGATDLLARVLAEPDLPGQIARLAPASLGALVARVGLEDAGEIVALASTEQLAHLFDEDLWRSERAGEDEAFDAARFVLWLEVLFEAGDAVVSARLAELPEDLLVLALHRRLIVLDLAELGAAVGSGGEDGEMVEKALADCLSEELEDFVVIARSPDGWDVVLRALLALDQDHHDLCLRLLGRCAHLSASAYEDLGELYQVLSEAEALDAEVSGDRRERRAAEGHVAPSDATSFLRGARAGASPETPRDAVVKAWLREIERAPQRAAPPATEVAESGVARLIAEARAADGEVASPRALPAGAATDELPFIAAMRRLAETNAAVFDARSEELAFLTNALMAGAGVEGRRFRPIEAVQAAIAVTNLGLELALSTPVTLAAATERLLATGADVLFRAGFGELTRLGARAAEVAASKAEPEIETRIRRAAEREALHEATPALIGLIERLGEPSVAALEGLFDACPRRAGALASGKEARASLRFLATRGDLRDALAFVAGVAGAVEPRTRPKARARRPRR